jgi:type IV pilus assembly protein PilC
MAVFKYNTLIKSERRKGVITATDKVEAESILRQRGETIVKLVEVRSSVSDSPFFSLRERPEWERKLSGLLIGGSRVEQSLQQFAAMLAGGVPILSALQTVGAQSPYFLSRAYFCVANRLHDGGRLSEILSHEMPFLGQVVIGLISAGEANGDIDKMCLYSAELISRRRVLKGQLLQALAYPAAVILVTIGIVCFLMYKVIPKIMTFLSRRSARLPAITQALVDVTNFLQEYGVYLALAPFVLALLIYFLRRNPTSGLYVDHSALYLPLVGKAFRASANALWCRTLGVLLGSGVNIITALEFTERSIANSFYRRELRGIKDLIGRGHPLSTGIRVSEINRFIPLADAMITVGENTGRVDDGLMKVAEFSEADLAKRINLLTKMIEPALFVIVGGIVGFVYIAFFMGLMAASTGGR